MNGVRVCPRCSKEYPAGTYGAHRSSHTPAHRLANRGKPGQPLSKHRTDVVYLLRRGISASQAGRKLGISRERVRQLWLAETGLTVPRLAERQPIDVESRRVRRFWANVQVDPSGCWLWTAARYQTGYGSYRGAGYGYAHRAAYSMVKGEIPAGLTIDHLCRVPACVNPDHLEAVTQRENTLRSPIAVAAINARKTHCLRGHEFSETNTRRDKHGRTCRTCDRDRRRGYVAPSRRKLVA